MVNLTEKIREICKKLETEGFNNVRFDNLYVEEEKLEDYWDEITEKGN